MDVQLDRAKKNAPILAKGKRKEPRGGSFDWGGGTSRRGGECTPGFGQGGAGGGIWKTEIQPVAGFAQRVVGVQGKVKEAW